MIDYGQRLVFAPDVIVQTIEGEALLLKLQDEEVFSLNPTAARIAQLIADGLRLDAVVDTLAAEYGLSSAEVEREVGNLIEALLAKGLVVVDRGQEDR
jgi:hypothetical protein